MRRRAMAHAIGFGLQGVIVHNCDAGPERILHTSRALLQHMRELVSEELLSPRGVRIVLAGREENVRAVCEGTRPDGTGFGSHVDANGGKIGAECRLHFLPHGVGQPLTDGSPGDRTVIIRHVTDPHWKVIVLIGRQSRVTMVSGALYV
jgi:hypothetical protein